jgi:hypothetical protein
MILSAAASDAGTRLTAKTPLSALRYLYRCKSRRNPDRLLGRRSNDRKYARSFVTESKPDEPG